MRRNPSYSPLFLASGMTMTIMTMTIMTMTMMIVRLKMRSGIFSGSGDLKIKCTAAIDPIYWKSSEESIQVIVMVRGHP